MKRRTISTRIQRLGAPIAIVLLLATSAWAWPGFTWEEWRESTRTTLPNITSPQAGHQELLPLLQTDFNDDSAINTTAEWEAKRGKILNTLEAVLGEPSTRAIPNPSARELGREDLGAYVRIHLRIASEADDSIPAYYLKPKERKGPKTPVMIVLHQTQAPGKREACGMIGDPDMAFAKELVERGIPCIVPDAIGFGERIPEGGQPYDTASDFYRKHPYWSFFGKMNWDISRVIDYLETLPEIDAERIGIMGHSHGAYGAIMGAVFELRIRLVVASCGFTMLRSDPSPNRWSHLTALMPRLGFYVDDIQQAPFDWHEIVACIAPRPYFNWATREDRIFPNTDNFTEVYKQVSSVYTLYGKDTLFTGKLGPGPHRIPPAIRQEAYQWIEAQFDQ